MNVFLTIGSIAAGLLGVSGMCWCLRKIEDNRRIRQYGDEEIRQYDNERIQETMVEYNVMVPGQ
jgi:hypothetical protein